MNKDELIAQREEILSLLYNRRLEERSKQGLYLSTKMLNDAVGECFFNLKLLQELECIEGNGFNYRLTGKGVEVFERK